MSLPVANLTDKLITSCRDEKTKTILKNAKNVGIYLGPDRRGIDYSIILMLGMLYFSDESMVLRTVIRIPSNVDGEDTWPIPHSISEYQVPIFRLLGLGYIDKEDFLEACLSIHRLKLPRDCTRIICSYLTPNLNNLMLVPDVFDHKSGLTLRQVKSRSQIYRSDDNENVLLGTTLRRRVNIASFEEYSKITTTGSYLGSYGGFSIYNTHGNCGFDIERLNPEIHKENIYDPEPDSDSESDYSYDYFDPYGDVNSNDYNSDNSDGWFSD